MDPQADIKVDFSAIQGRFIDTLYNKIVEVRVTANDRYPLRGKLRYMQICPKLIELEHPNGATTFLFDFHNVTEVTS